MCTFPGESRDFAGVAVLFASHYIYMYTHMYITHVYLHVYTYVYHACVFTCINICISHMYIYIHKHMYITHLAALSLSCSFQCLQRTHPAAFKSTRDTRVCTDTHRNTSIDSRSLARVYGTVHSSTQAAHSSTQAAPSSTQHADRQITATYNSTVYITHVYLHV